MMALSKVIALLMIVTCVCGYYGSRFSKREPSDRLCNKLREAYENTIMNKTICQYGSYYLNTCQTPQCYKGPSEPCVSQSGYGRCGKNLICCKEICRGCFDTKKCDKSVCTKLASEAKRNKLPQQLIQQQQQQQQQKEQQFKQLLQQLFFTPKEISPELTEPESTEIDNYHYY